MGMYTGLRAKLLIKDEYWPVIDMLMKRREGVYWEDVAEAFPQYPFLKEWADVGRCDFIPFGALAYMPWLRGDPEWRNEFCDGVWTFQCSLKNYEGEIEYFVESILSRIVDVCYELYSLYEENEDPEQLFIPEVGCES